MNNLTPVILCGGNGTRLWPQSRSSFPKQFTKSPGSDLSMLQNTLKRCSFCDSKAIVICNEEHRFVIAEQLRTIEYQSNSIILEPIARNTAAAIALAAFKAQDQDTDPTLLVMPSDQLLDDVDSFEKATNDCSTLVNEGMIITFGITPDKAETGYGYIELGETISKNCHQIDSFIEKPGKDKAQELINTGRHLWNSGMFLVKASAYLQQLNIHQPEIYSHCRKAISSATCDSSFTTLNIEDFRGCPNISIDYAIMEHTDQAAVAPLDNHWSDLGCWDSIYEASQKDSDGDGNVISGDVIQYQSSNCLVKSNSRLVATAGLDNIVVIETADAVLVAHREQSQNIKHLVSQLIDQERSEHKLHREVFRPWGQYQSIDDGQRFQVKHITVKPGEKLSVQMHHHRAEHWVVVSGTAKVTNGEVTSLLTENQSTYIPIGVTHCLENPGMVPLELIEVQSGSYLGEDDIVRFADLYGRQ